MAGAASIYVYGEALEVAQIALIAVIITSLKYLDSLWEIPESPLRGLVGAAQPAWSR